MSASGARLAAVTKEIMLQWQQTKNYWGDAKSREFEQKYLQELGSGVDKAVAVIDQLDKLIAKIKHDCE